MNKSTILLLVLFALMLTSCFTLHEPAYLVSEYDKVNPQNAYRKTGTATANYFLVFGGNKKAGIMSAARADLWNNLNGAQDLNMGNIVVDESKQVFLFLFAKHKVQIEAYFFPTDAFRDTAALEAVPRGMYGFLPDDRVIFKYVTPITGERRILLGTIYSPKEKKVLLDSSQLPGQDSSGAFYVVPSFAPNLLTISQVGLAQGTQVSFNPINRRGNYFEGTVVSTTSDYDVWVELSPAYVDQWYGENQPHGNRIVHVPSYRIRKLE